MTDNPVVNLVDQQEWLQPLGEKSDAFVNTALTSVGNAEEATRDALVNSRLLGHTRHPTITDVPFGSFTVTLVSDALELAGQEQFSEAADTGLLIGLTASVIASAGGLADLSETAGQTDRRLGMMHGIFQGISILLYAGSFAARRTNRRGLGQTLGFLGFGALVASSYLANELSNKRSRATQG